MAKARKATTTTETDPIFAAIKTHQRLDETSLALARAADQAGTPEDKALARAVDAAEKAAWKMARTKPRTAAGAAAMLAYITTDTTNGLFELGETSWHEAAFRTVVASFNRLFPTAVA